MKIMFICTGNICRSAMADWLMKKKLEDIGEKQVEIYSCGIYAENGDNSTFNAIEVMKKYDVDLKKHRATNIRNSNIQEMDLILCATTSHKIATLDMYPELEGKVYTLKEYVEYKVEGRDLVNISDPWGYDVSVYEFCVQEIDTCLDILINKIRKSK